METELTLKCETLELDDEIKVLGPISGELFHSDLSGAKERRELSRVFDSIFTQIPDSTMDIDTALDLGFVSSTETARFYDSISDFVESDENNRRLLLYLPFEILPDLSNSEDLPENVLRSAKRFGEIYKDAWVALLHESESRANFVDGDILEPGLPEPEKISKAGHLTPEILAKGIISAEDISLLLELISDPQLIKSLAQGAVVANDRGLFSQSEWEKIKGIIDQRTPNLEDSENSEFFDPNSPRISPERAAWLRKVEAEERDGTTANYLPGQGTLSMYLDQQQRFGIDSTQLPFKFSEKGFGQILEAVKVIRENPDLSHSLYPGFLVFGSRVKGYGDDLSDLDVAVFFKPEARQEEKNEAIVRLSRIPGLSGVKLSHYQVEEDSGEYRFRNPQEESRISYGEEQLHFFFGGAWVTCNPEFIKIRDSLVKNYLELPRFEDQREAVRRRILGHLELDVLQYRLMHKGYRKFYPLVRRNATQNSDLIDFNSDFWDPGFRRVATKLFLAKVFLPDLSFRFNQDKL
jgi:hypothetical protein